MYNKRKYIGGALRNILHKRLKHEEFEKVCTRGGHARLGYAVQVLMPVQSR